MNEMNNEGFALGWDDEFTNEQPGIRAAAGGRVPL